MSSRNSLLFIIIAIRLLCLSNAQSNLNYNMDHCFSGNSVNITALEGASNGSLTIRLSAEQKKEYVFEISYNNSLMLTDNRAQSCFCKHQQCIKLCSYDILDQYNDMFQANLSSDDMEIFNIMLTLTNGTIVQRHIIHDFQPVVFNSFCKKNYTLSPKVDFKNSWALFENETLLRHHDETYLTGNDYCFDIDIDEYTDTLMINPLNCAIEIKLSTFEILNNATMVISVPFFLLTIFAYCLIKELRNIHGKCFVSYLSSITLSYSLLSFINLSRMRLEIVPCVLIGFFNHFFQLSHYTWLGIISYDNWKSCRSFFYNSSYVDYACFGWLMPFLWTIMTMVAQVSDLPESLKPGITPQHCGLEVNKWSASIYLYGPCLVVLIFCLYTFILSSRHIKKNVKDVAEHRVANSNNKIRYTLYLRLFVVMGLSWFMDVISYLLSMFEMNTWSYIMDFLNAVQGLYIFVNFIGRRSVRGIIKEKFRRLDQKGKFIMNSDMYRNRSTSWN